jgi:hypothetical protein
MFSYTGFSVEQVRRLRDEFGVYLIDSGRVCMSGLRPANLRQVAEAFAAVQKLSPAPSTGLSRAALAWGSAQLPAMPASCKDKCNRPSEKGFASATFHAQSRLFSG